MNIHSVVISLETPIAFSIVASLNAKYCLMFNTIINRYKLKQLSLKKVDSYAIPNTTVVISHWITSGCQCVFKVSCHTFSDMEIAIEISKEIVRMYRCECRVTVSDNSFNCQLA